MVVIMRDEGFCPGADALIKGFGCGLVWEEEGDAMGVEGGDSVAFDECESVNDAKEVILYLKVILRDVNRNDRVTFVRGNDFLKKNSVSLS